MASGTELRRYPILETGSCNLLESQVRGPSSLSAGRSSPWRDAAGQEGGGEGLPCLSSFTHTHHCYVYVASEYSMTFHSLRIKPELLSSAQPYPSLLLFASSSASPTHYGSPLRKQRHTDCSPVTSSSPEPISTNSSMMTALSTHLPGC